MAGFHLPDQHSHHWQHYYSAKLDNSNQGQIPVNGEFVWLTCVYLVTYVNAPYPAPSGVACVLPGEESNIMIRPFQDCRWLMSAAPGARLLGVREQGCRFAAEPAPARVGQAVHRTYFHPNLCLSVSICGGRSGGNRRNPRMSRETLRLASAAPVGQCVRLPPGDAARRLRNRRTLPSEPWRSWRLSI
jgi:hypothetical protein